MGSKASRVLSSSSPFNVIPIIDTPSCHPNFLSSCHAILDARVAHLAAALCYPQPISSRLIRAHALPCRNSSRNASRVWVCHPGTPESYIIAWVSVENRQGEDKGVMIIYPTSLCVRSLFPNIPSLPHIPTLPATLQSSPQSTPSLPFLSVSSPTSVSAFRTLTISKSRDINRVAKEVGGYVDAVAKERERERERLKREREGVGTTVVQPSSAQVPHLYVQQQVQLQQQQQTQQQQMQQQQQAQQQQQMLDFYPSPPQTNLMVPPPSGHVSPVAPVAAPMEVDPLPNPAPFAVVL